MTEESLKQANAIKDELDRITRVKRDIMCYHNERIELDITWKKGLMHFNASEDSKRHYTLYSDDPLMIAIEAALEGMREELQEKLDHLDSNIKERPIEAKKFEAYHPISQTSWWKKAFSWI